jgi:hypothetical protein
MKVKIEMVKHPLYGPDALTYQVRILDGYCAGQLLRFSDTEYPMYDSDFIRLRDWLQGTGYEVVNPEPGDQ